MLLGLGCGSALAQALPDPPNVLMIVYDDLDWYGDLEPSPYGSPTPDVQTPFSNLLASEGLVFSHFYVNAPICSPTRVALLTGQYPTTLGLNWVLGPNSRRGIPEDMLTTARLFSDAGYATGTFGKWHAGMNSDDPDDEVYPAGVGFETSVVECSYLNPASYYPQFCTAPDEPIYVFNPDDPELFATSFTITKATEFIENAVNDERPFFAQIWLNAPHGPLTCPPEDPPGHLWQCGTNRETKAAMISQAEYRLYGLYERLNDPDVDAWANTLVILTSDNGGRTQVPTEELQGAKGSTHERGIRTPLLVRGPDVTHAAEPVDDVVIGQDFLPTFADLLEVSGYSGPGRSMATLFDDDQGNDPPEDRTLFWEGRPDNPGLEDDGITYLNQHNLQGPWLKFVVRKTVPLDDNARRWKLVQDNINNHGVIPELYDFTPGVTVNRIAEWDGSAWSALSGPSGTGVSDSVSALAVFDASSGPALYAGGEFTTAGGVTVNSIARWGGGAWSPLTGPSGTGVDGSVAALAVFGPALYAGGEFTTAGGVPVNSIARWDGSGWSALAGPSGTGVAGSVYALAVFGSALYAGGGFTTAGGVPVNSIARWDGSAWSALSGPSGTGMDNPVYALAVFDDGSGPALYAGGGFTTAGGVPVNSIARWDGSAWSPLSGPSGTGVAGSVYALAVFGSALYAGGEFTTAGGMPVSRIARWDGSAWSPLSGTPGAGTSATVHALAVFDDSSGAALYAGGSFVSADGVALSRIARWSGSAWSAVSGPSGTGVDSSVYALAVLGPALYAGGGFATAADGESESVDLTWDEQNAPVRNHLLSTYSNLRMSSSNLDWRVDSLGGADWDGTTFTFDSGDMVTLRDNPGLTASDASDLSFSLTMTPSSSGKARILERKGSWSLLRLGGPTNKLCFQVRNGDNTAWVQVVNPVPILPGNEYRVTAALEYGRSLSLYVNDVQAKLRARLESVWSTDYPVTMGRHYTGPPPYTGYPVDPYAGTISNLEIHPIAVRTEDLELDSVVATGFEAGLGPISGVSNGSLGLVQDPVHRGQQALEHYARLADSYTLSEDIPTDTGIEFQLTAWVKGTVPGQDFTEVALSLLCLDGNHNLVNDYRGFSTTVNYATPDWQRITHQHLCPSGTAFVSFRLENREAGSTVYWDDVTIGRTGKALLDAHFEAETPGVCGVQFHVTPQTANTGLQSMVLPPGQRSCRHEIQVEGGASHVVYSLWAKTQRSAYVKLGLYCLNGDREPIPVPKNLGNCAVGEATDCIESRNGAVGPYWQKFQLYNSCPASTEEIGIMFESAGAEVWVDDLAVTVTSLRY